MLLIIMINMIVPCMHEIPHNIKYFALCSSLQAVQYLVDTVNREILTVINFQSWLSPQKFNT